MASLCVISSSWVTGTTCRALERTLCIDCVADTDHVQHHFGLRVGDSEHDGEPDREQYECTGLRNGDHVGLRNGVGMANVSQSDLVNTLCCGLGC